MIDRQTRQIFTLREVFDTCQEENDLLDDDFFSNKLLIKWCNEAVKDAYSFLYGLDNGRHFRSEHIITVVNGVSEYKLPHNIYDQAITRIFFSSDANTAFKAGRIRDEDELELLYTLDGGSTSKQFRWEVLNYSSGTSSDSFDETNPTIKSFTDSDVNTTTNVITCTNHNLYTGEEIRLYNFGGTLPGGTATTSRYWVIELTDNTFALATSYLLAMTGTKLDITSAAGGGTHYIDSLTKQMIRFYDIPNNGGIFVIRHNRRPSLFEYTETAGVEDTNYSDYCDLPESFDYVCAYVNRKIAIRNRQWTLKAEFEKDMLRWQTNMVNTMSPVTPDGDNEVDGDTYHYQNSI